MVNLSRRKSTSDLQKARIGSTIVLAGWEEKSKHLGKLAFLSLRDREGYAQIVANKKFMGLQSLKDLTRESVVSVKGKVKTSKAKIGGKEFVVATSSARKLGWKLTLIALGCATGLSF